MASASNIRRLYEINFSHRQSMDLFSLFDLTCPTCPILTVTSQIPKGHSLPAFSTPLALQLLVCENARTNMRASMIIRELQIFRPYLHGSIGFYSGTRTCSWLFPDNRCHPCDVPGRLWQMTFICAMCTSMSIVTPSIIILPLTGVVFGPHLVSRFCHDKSCKSDTTPDDEEEGWDRQWE